MIAPNATNGDRGASRTPDDVVEAGWAMKADDGSRTRDLRLGMPTKYLLSPAFWRISDAATGRLAPGSPN